MTFDLSGYRQWSMLFLPSGALKRNQYLISKARRLSESQS